MSVDKATNPISTLPADLQRSIYEYFRYTGGPSSSQVEPAVETTHTTNTPPANTSPDIPDQRLPEHSETQTPVHTSPIRGDKRNQMDSSMQVSDSKKINTNV